VDELIGFQVIHIWSGVGFLDPIRKCLIHSFLEANSAPSAGLPDLPLERRKDCQFGFDSFFVAHVQVDAFTGL
jgi:hypothetical protein